MENEIIITSVSSVLNLEEQCYISQRPFFSRLLIFSKHILHTLCFNGNNKLVRLGYGR